MARTTPPLSAMQQRVVEHGTSSEALDMPPGFVVHDMGHADLTTPEGLRLMHSWRPPSDSPELGTTAGWCGVMTITLPPAATHSSTHYARRFSGGGDSGSWHDSYNAAVASLAAEGKFHRKFWLAWAERVGTDLDPRGHQVIRADGGHFVIGAEPAPGGYRDGLGMGGRRMEFVLTTGPRAGLHVVSHNVWSQGAIPTDLRHLLPPNARQARMHGPRETWAMHRERGGVLDMDGLVEPQTQADRRAILNRRAASS